MHWYSLTPQESAQILATNLEKGLSTEEVQAKLATSGPNKLAESKKRSLFQMFFAQFKELLVLLLMGAAVVSALVGEVLDATVILAIVILNGIIGFLQEHKAEKSLEALKKLVTPQACAIRDGSPVKIPAEQLVPGDIIMIEAGDYIPADARLFSAVNLSVDESILTGESLPVEKQTEALPNEEIPTGNCNNQVFMGTLATYGNGAAIVVSTGMSTEIGQIATLLEEVEEEKTPLQVKLAELSKWLGGIVLILCGIIFLTGVLRGTPFLDMFLTAISLAVAAIPEGLPAVVTMVLALGVQRMAKRNAIIRKLPAVETLGAATIICSDKTGTLTKNEMTVRYLATGNHFVRVTGEGYRPEGAFLEEEQELNLQQDSEIKTLLGICALTNNAHINKKTEGTAEKWEILGDPTEAALSVTALKGGYSRQKLEEDTPRIGEIPFDSERKMMTTIHPAGFFQEASGTPYIACMKGAFDVLLKKCSHVYKNGMIQPLTKETVKDFETLNEKLAGKALRVLGMAYKPLVNLPEDEEPDEIEKNLIFVGLAAMIDPPRPEVKEAVEVCLKAGIKPVMITGDHKITALAIAIELGIFDEKDMVLTGAELDKLADEEFSRIVEKVRVYARVAPKHKVQIVEALKKKNHVVAMTGDGVNDAPALRRADIGAAMGITGTDVAKEAADMVLADDNFATIIAAVKRGRTIFTNIRKVVHYLLSCNSSELLTIFVAIAAGLPTPLLPLQILWVNLITDSLPAFALGNDPEEKEIMKKPPRDPLAGIFSGGIGQHIIYQGLLLAALALTAFWTGYQGQEELLARGRTMAFGTLSLVQITHSFNIRHLYNSLFRVGIFSNKYLLGAAGISIALQLLVMISPSFQKVFKTIPLSLEDWLLITVLAISPLLIEEIVKIGKRSRLAA